MRNGNKQSGKSRRHGGPPARSGRHSGKKPGRKSAGSDSRRINASLWGFHAVREAWLNPAREIRAFYATGQALKAMEDVLEEARQKGLSRPAPELVDRKNLDRRLQGAVHQGLALEADPLPEIFVADLIARAALKDKSVLVMLDQVTDPHNIGAILRSASAFGADGLIMQTRHAPDVTGILAKTASGAVEHVPIAYETNLGRAVQQLQEAGFTALALDERGDVELGALAPPEKTLFILGAEGKGLRQSLREQCDRLVRLPTGGPVASLNVSNAAAVALYALRAR